MAEETLVIFTTWPSAESARAAARTLIEERLAACANIVPGVESIYRWKDAIETSAEVLVIFKATMGSYPRFEARLKELHPYEVPEVVALRPTDGLPAYLRWVEDNAR
jgi:periplasmic divalent cation tolerance protein